jgi:hypothetical protein
MLFTLPAIREYVRRDFSQDGTTGFISTDDIDRWVNEGYMRYVHHLMLADAGYFEQTFQLGITSGQEEIALPTIFDGRGKFMKSMLLERVNSTERIPLRFHKRYNEANSTSGGLSGFSYLPTWKFRGNNIILEPTPTFTEAASSTTGLLLTAQVMPPRLRSATAQAGTGTTITLDTGADPRNDYYKTTKIFIVSGTGAGQVATISGYVGLTKVATVSSTFSPVPDLTSVYSIVIHEDFPEDFHEMLPLYALKCALGKERSMTTDQQYLVTRLATLESDFKNYVEDRTTARKFMQPWNIELF